MLQQVFLMVTNLFRFNEPLLHTLAEVGFPFTQVLLTIDFLSV